MTSRINPRAIEKFNVSEIELEILHMISFEYNMDEMIQETGLEGDEVESLIKSLHKTFDTGTFVGLIRAAFENRVLLITQV